MSFIESALLPDEKILFRTKKSVIIFFTPVLWTLITLFFYFNANSLVVHVAFIPGILAILSWLNELLNYVTSDFVVTTKRIFMKEGFFFRHVNETRLATVANISSNQSLLGQFLNYGTLFINSFGGESDPFMQIDSPNEFQKTGAGAARSHYTNQVSHGFFNQEKDMKQAKMILVGGWSMVIFAILFIGITLLTDLISTSQPLLYGLERHALFKVMAGTDNVRYLISLLSILPLLFIPAAVGACCAFSEKYEMGLRVGLHFATVAAVALTLSLMMLPSMNWILTAAIPSFAGETQSAMITLIQAFHRYLGMYIGDILGLGSMLVWFFIVSISMIKSETFPRIIGVIELILALIITAILVVRYTALLSDIHVYIQIDALMSLWMFIGGITLISLRRD